MIRVSWRQEGFIRADSPSMRCCELGPRGESCASRLVTRRVGIPIDGSPTRKCFHECSSTKRGLSFAFNVRAIVDSCSFPGSRQYKWCRIPAISYRVRTLRVAPQRRSSTSHVGPSLRVGRLSATSHWCRTTIWHVAQKRSMNRAQHGEKSLPDLVNDRVRLMLSPLQSH